MKMLSKTNLIWERSRNIKGFQRHILSTILLVFFALIIRSQETNKSVNISLSTTPAKMEMSGGDSHHCQVNLEKGEFFQVKVEQKGIDVLLKLTDHQNNVVAQMDSPNGDSGFEVLTFVPDFAGSFTLEIASLNKESGKGAYVIQREHPRVATEADRKQAITERIFFEGISSINSNDETVIKAAIVKLKEALTGWQEFKNEDMLSLTRYSIKYFEDKLEQIELEKRPQIVVQTSHGLICSVTFSPDNKILATGGLDGTIKLWEVNSGREIRTLAGHQATAKVEGKNPTPVDSKDPLINIFNEFDNRSNVNTPFSLAFSPDGKTLASGSDARNIILWDVATGKPQKVIPSPVSVWFITFSKDGKTILSQSEFKKEENLYRFYDVNSGQELKNNLPSFSNFNIPWQTQDGKQTAVYGENESTIKILNSDKTIISLDGHEAGVRRAIFDPADNILASGGWDRTVRLWDTKNGKLLKILGNHDSFVSALTFSSDGRLLASGSKDGVVKIWNMSNKTQIATIRGYTTGYVTPFGFGEKNDILWTTTDSFTHIWDLQNGRKMGSAQIHDGDVSKVIFSPDKKLVATSDETVLNIVQFARMQDIKRPPDFDKWAKGLHGDKVIRLWDMEKHSLKKKFQISTNNNDSVSAEVRAMAFSHDGKMLAAGNDAIIKIWKVETDENPITITGKPAFLTFSRNDKFLAVAGDWGEGIKLWDLETRKALELPKGKNNGIIYVKWMAFSANNEYLICYLEDYERSGIYQIYNLKTSGLEEEISPTTDPEKVSRIYSLIPDLYQQINYPFTDDNKFYVTSDLDGRIALYYNGEDSYSRSDDKLLAWLIALGDTDWAVITPDGRFDTNKLENPEGLNWIFPDAPLKPLPFEILMRDYYEPGLLPRLMKCTENGNCDKEFKKIDKDFSLLNRTQPKIEITNILPTDSPEIIKVTVEATDVKSEYQKDSQERFLHSGVDDLRLFRDGQLVAYAPNGENESEVGLDKNGKAVFTFDVRLPRNSRLKQVEFSAYAFNSDRVKSETSRKIYNIENPLPDIKRKAYIITIGVNHNENPNFDLSYAAKDANDMQREVGSHLLATGNYADVIQVSLISDEINGKLIIDASKAKIKAVFDALAGRAVPGEILKGIPDSDRLTKVRPEDFVLIAFSGHGYADQNGIFYFVPYDMGENTDFADALQNGKLVSSNELSFWLRDIDAGEMTMIIDACHSAAAFQGKDFKPGPMGSRGLGQLSYDKGIKILAATHANSTASETGSLENGLLTYALVTDGIIKKGADFQPQDKSLTIDELLNYGVKRVPELYKDKTKIKDIPVENEVESNINIQQPVLFDFTNHSHNFELWKIE